MREGDYPPRRDKDMKLREFIAKTNEAIRASEEPVRFAGIGTRTV